MGGMYVVVHYYCEAGEFEKVGEQQWAAVEGITGKHVRTDDSILWSYRLASDRELLRVHRENMILYKSYNLAAIFTAFTMWNLLW